MKKAGRILALTILSLILVSIFAAAIVSAQEQPAPGAAGAAGTGVLNEPNVKATQQTATESTKKIFEWIGSSKGGTMTEELKSDIARVLLMLLVILLVFTMSTVIPFMETAKPGVKWAVAIIIGVLSFMFIEPEAIKAIAGTYEALGVALTSIIPLIVIIAFGYRLKQQNAAMAMVINKALYLGFAGYLIFKFATFGSNTALKNPTPEIRWLYIICAAVVLFWMFFEKRIARQAREEELKETMELAEHEMALSTQADILAAKKMRVEAAAAKKANAEKV